MKTAIRWTVYLTLQVSIFALLAAWKMAGNEHAGNLVQAILWTMSATGFIVGFANASGTHMPRDPVMALVDIALDCALLLILAWYGHFLLAVFYLLGRIGSSAYRDRFDSDGNPLPRAKPARAEP